MTFPLALPAAAFRVRGRPLFDIDPNGDSEISSPTWGGLVQSISAGRRLWHMRYDLVPLREGPANEVIAALRRLRGSTRRFRALDPLRRIAQAYPNGYAGMVRAGGGTFDGSATVQAIGAALDTLTLSGLPAGFVLTPGDLLSFGFGGTRQALHAVVIGGAASGSGLLAVTIEPVLIPGVEVGTTVSMLDPWCKAALVKRTFTVAPMANRRYVISFAAVQDISP